MRTTFVRVDVVREGHDGVCRIGRGPLHGDFHRAVRVLRLEINRLIERFLAFVEIFHEVPNTAGIDKFFRMGLAFVIQIALVMEDNVQTFVQECHLTETVCKRRVVEHSRFGEDLRVGPERDLRARMLRRAHFAQLFDRLAALEGNLVNLAIARHLDFQAR